jgi:hypothetical protein
MQSGDLHTWHKRLKAKHEACELTLDEAQLLATLDIRNNLIHHSEALNELIESHGTVEGVVTSVDQLLQATYGPAYPGLQRGKLSAGRPQTGHDVAGALTEGA